MRKRTGKFYNKNEKETLLKLGLTPAPQSGAGWIVKEDGENEDFMVQLKSTDASSYRIDMLDIKKLEYHASVSNKIPMFLIQFLKQDKLYCLLEVNELLSVNTLEKLNKLYSVNLLNLSKLNLSNLTNRRTHEEENLVIEENTEIQKPKIKSSKNAREKFFKEREEKYGKRK